MLSLYNLDKLTGRVTQRIENRPDCRDIHGTHRLTFTLNKIELVNTFPSGKVEGFYKYK